MEFTEIELAKAGFSSEEVEHLRQRNRGGVSGAAGYLYQRRYALLRTIELAPKSAGAIVQMEALCPVDDVVVEAPILEFSQCKISTSVTWTADDKKVAKEFKAQRKLLKALGRQESSFALKLIVRDAGQRTRLEKKTPRTLAQSTTVECVPVSDPEHHPWTVPRFATALDALLPPMLRGIISRREDLLQALDAAADHPWQSRTIKDITLRAAAKKEDLAIVLPIPPPSTVSMVEWSKASASLQAVPNLQIDLTGGNCCYSAPHEVGFIARCDTRRFRRFVDAVLATPPHTMQDFFMALP